MSDGTEKFVLTGAQEKELAELIALRVTPPPPKNDPNKKYPYQLVHFDDLQPSPTALYIVDELIPRNGIVAVWGPPKSGKSFWTFDLVMHVACGWAYRGRRAEHGIVVYLAFEGAEGFRARAEAFRRTHEIKNEHPWERNPRFHLLATNAKLVRDHKALIESIDGQIELPPTVVVLDTLNRSIDGSESKDQDMGAYIAAAEVICDAFDCVVIVVHHSGVDTSRPRGHTSLSGAANVQIAVRRDNARNVVAEIEAMKDGPEGATFTSELKVVEVGIDIKTRKPMTSCVIVPVDSPPSVSTRAKVHLTANQKRFLDILTDAVLDAPAEHKTTDGIPAGRTAISREWLKMCCKSKGWFDPEASDNNNRAKVSNTLNALAGKRLLGATALFVWDAR